MSERWCKVITSTKHPPRLALGVKRLKERLSEMTTTTVSTTTTTTVEMTSTSVELSAEVQAIVSEFSATRSMITELEKTKKALEARIREALGEAETGTVEGVTRLTVSPRTRVTVDSAKLAEAFPEAYEATNKVTEYTVLTVK